MEEEESPPPHIVFFSTTGKGHLIPLVEFVRRLLHLHAVTVTVILPDDGSPLQPLKDLFHSLPSINPIFLPTVTFHDLPENAQIESRIILAIVRSIPALRKLLAELNQSAAPLSAFVGNIFATFAFEAVKELGIPVYMMYCSGAFPISFAFHVPELHVTTTCEYRDLPEPLKLPGCLPLHGSDFVDPLQVRGTPEYEFILDLCRKINLAEGVLVNSFFELEPETFKALAAPGSSSKHPPVYPVGPLTRPVSGEGAECLDWLDNQPEKSVLYVSFGSGGTLSGRQLKELATGLEMSGQRFLLVVRKPNDVVRSGAYFAGEISETGKLFLPPGFLQRVEGKGFVVEEWAPQVEVLSHAAVGGFLTHCGWNSTLESIVHGVPMIAWPLFAEQKINAVLLSEGLKVAERVREDENGVVDGERISGMVRRLMEGEEGAEMRRRVVELKEAGGRAIGEGGSSTGTLADVVEIWKGRWKSKDSTDMMKL